MPLKHFPENVLAIPLHHVAMARDHGGKVPLINALDAVADTGAVLGGEIPVEALHPRRVASRALGALEQLVGKAAGFLAVGHFAVLLQGGQVEHEIGLDEHLVGLVVEDNLLVGVAVDVLVVKVGVELVADLDAALVGLGEDDGEGVVADLGVLVLLGALLDETVGADDLGAGVLLGPFRDEDVVLEIKGDDVGHLAAQLGHLGFGLFCEGDGREDGEVARGKFDWGESWLAKNVKRTGM